MEGLLFGILQEIVVTIASILFHLNINEIRTQNNLPQEQIKNSFFLGPLLVVGKTLTNIR